MLLISRKCPMGPEFIFSVRKRTFKWAQTVVVGDPKHHKSENVCNQCSRMQIMKSPQRCNVFSICAAVVDLKQC
jgi:hypothetical protein